MAALYLILLVGWLALVGAVRSAIHLRRSGTVPLRVDDPRGAPQWWARVLATAGLVAAIGAPLADVAGVEPLGPRGHPAAVVAGVLLVVVGTVGTLWAQSTMGDSWRADVDPEARTELVVDGPFRRVRNPIIVGTALTAAGLAAILPNPLTAAMLVLFVTTWEVQIRLVEEPYLARVHGDRYRSYAARTGRFVPGIGRRRAG